MIVLDRDSGLLIIRQPDHAAQSARVAERFRRPAAIPAAVWPRFVDAVRRHDDGWIEEEKLCILRPSGRPCDFMTHPGNRHVDIWRRSAELAERHDPYAGLIVAQHGLRLWRRSREDSSRGYDLKFPGEMEAAIERNRRALLAEAAGGPMAAGAGDEALLLAGRLLGFFDGLSLVLLGAIPLFDRTEPMSFGDREACLELAREDGVICMEPWPFLERVVSLEARALRLEGKTFARPEEFAAAMDGARPEEIRCEIRERA